MGENYTMKKNSDFVVVETMEDDFISLDVSN